MLNEIYVSQHHARPFKGGECVCACVCDKKYGTHIVSSVRIHVRTFRVRVCLSPSKRHRASTDSRNTRRRTQVFPICGADTHRTYAPPRRTACMRGHMGNQRVSCAYARSREIRNGTTTHTRSYNISFGTIFHFRLFIFRGQRQRQR